MGIYQGIRLEQSRGNELHSQLHLVQYFKVLIGIPGFVPGKKEVLKLLGMSNPTLPKYV